ncbi:hypothetical protein [Pseudohalioglobus sediminis]|uniref:hypothetical protein n=1 Tax=Pseudohalioglobus sediminis TaxID=2606449 RepID=UPI00165FE357|nr:hypothetical protein [Pseudohalioglobus sediminis]
MDAEVFSDKIRIIVIDLPGKGNAIDKLLANEFVCSDAQTIKSIRMAGGLVISVRGSGRKKATQRVAGKFYWFTQDAIFVQSGGG